MPEEKASQIWQRILQLGPVVFEAIQDHETQREHQPWEPHNAQTDYLGLDVMIEERDGELVPVIIEVNDHESGGQLQLGEDTAPLILQMNFTPTNGALPFGFGCKPC